MKNFFFHFLFFFSFLNKSEKVQVTETMTLAMDEIARRCLDQLEACVDRIDTLAKQVERLEMRVQELEAVVYDSASEAEEITDEESLTATSSIEHKPVVGSVDDSSSLSDDDDDDDDDSDELSAITAETIEYEAERSRAIQDRDKVFRVLEVRGGKPAQASTSTASTTARSATTKTSAKAPKSDVVREMKSKPAESLLKKRRK